MKQSYKKSLGLLLMLCLLFGMFSGFGNMAFAADAADYTALGATYTATARVDESIGLRAAASIGSAVGITPMDTRLSRTNASHDATNDDTLQVTVAPYERYSVTQTVVTAIATITHPTPTGYAAGTVEAVKSVYTETTSPGSFTYSVPNFTAYVKSGDKIDVEIIVYADFGYTPKAPDYTIDLTNAVVTDATSVNVSASFVSGKLITIDTNTHAGKTFRIIGTTSFDILTGNYQLRVYNSTKDASKRTVHLIFDDAKMFTRGMNATNYKTVSGEGTPSSFESNVYSSQVAGPIRTSNSSLNSYALLSLADVDAYVTCLGENILSHSYTTANGGDPNASAVQVDASASFIVTEASTGSLYARGGGCSAAIGSSSYTYPCGYVEIDGGTVTAISAHNTHAYAGIGNGGHYDGQDPGSRGIVINGGIVNAMGFHYGIGANGGARAGSHTFSSEVGEQYVLITGGDVTSEASAGSAGAAIGFAYNNDQHEVRIGRPDKADSATKVFSVNWGYGAAISGKMTFYSGTTSAYSGQYAAAIGGNAVSDANTSAATEASAQSAYSAVAGTPLTAFGGKVTAVAGAFAQEGYAAYSTTDVSKIRGDSGTRTSAADVLTQLRPNSSYGAAIGGAISKAGGSSNYIFAGTFNITSSVSGAGIGGGGAYSNTLNAGGGGNTWIGPLTELDGGNTEPMSFNVKSDLYGAAVGGGGSDGRRTGGSGGNLYIAGGKFDIESGLFGAGIGGGGSVSGTAGGGGNVLIDSVTDKSIISQWDGSSVTPSTYNFEIESGQFGAGIGGGGSASGTAGLGASLLTIKGGNFGISGGNKTHRAYDTTSYGSVSYGAGIGGGGSYSGTGGNGPASAFITGGYFNCFSEGFGAAIGGGGSNSAAAGVGGTTTYDGGTVEVYVPDNLGSVGTGGGHSASGTSYVNVGQMNVTGGNIYCANPRALSITAIKMEVPVSEIGKLVDEVAVEYMGSYNKAYGTNDTYVTASTDSEGDPTGVVWIWVPSGYGYKLTYNLTSGLPSTSYSSTVSNGGANDFNIVDASKDAVGHVYITMAATQEEYHYSGDLKTLISWDDLIKTDATHDGINWGLVRPGANYHSGAGNQFYKLTEHAQVNGKSVYLLGWSLAEVTESDGTTEHIFAAHDGWDILDYKTDSMQTYNENITVYAIWGFDEDGNGTPDIYEGTYTVTYHANGGANAPADSSSPYAAGSDVAVLGPDSMLRSNHEFKEWNTKSDGSGQVYVEGDTLRPIYSDITLYAQWTRIAEDAIFYSVKFDSKGGSAIADKPVISGDTLTKPADPTRAGYIFTGWFTDESCSSRYNFSAKVAKSFTLYAGWQLDLFDDDNGHWAEPFINSLASQGFVNGIGNRKYAPNEPLSRAQFVQMLYNIWGNGDTTAPADHFNDTDPAAWYAKAVNWAYASGLIEGYNEKSFGPADPLTREQMAALIVRAAKKYGVDLTSTIPKTHFADDSDIGNWSRDAVYTMQQTGIIEGKPGNLFDPRGTLLRCEMAKVMYYVLDLSGMIADEYKVD